MQQSSEGGEAFSVSVVGPGVTIEKKVSQTQASEIINFLMTGKAPSSAPATAAGGSNSPVGSSNGAAAHTRRTSLREFLDDHEATRNPDKITAIGAYLEQVEGKDGFTRDDVRLKFRSAGESAPGNYGRDFSWAMQSGWIAEDPQNAGTFFVTKKGRAAIDAKFSRDVQKPQDRRFRRRGDAESADGNDE